MQVSGKQPSMKITGDFNQLPQASLSLPLGGSTTPLAIEGQATLAGNLKIAASKQLSPGQSQVILQADQITGTFANANGEVVSSDGTQLMISYSDSAVTLTAR